MSKKTSEKSESEATEATQPEEVILDPNARVTVQLYSAQNAGKTVKSRFGAVAFDAQGGAALEVTVGDLGMLDQLQWLTPEDRVKYGLIAHAPEAKASDPRAELKAKLDAVLAENNKLGQDNLVLQAKLDKANEDLVASQAECERLKHTISVMQSPPDRQDETKKAKAASTKSKS